MIRSLKTCLACSHSVVHVVSIEAQGYSRMRDAIPRKTDKDTKLATPNALPERCTTAMHRSHVYNYFGDFGKEIGYAGASDRQGERKSSQCPYTIEGRGRGRNLSHTWSRVQPTSFPAFFFAAERVGGKRPGLFLPTPSSAEKSAGNEVGWTLDHTYDRFLPLPLPPIVYGP